MANPPPPYANISGITRTIMKDNQEETISNYNGNARPGELVVDLTNNDVYIGNTNGNLTLINTGGGSGNSEPAGAVGAIQLNAGGNLFGSSANLSFANNTLTTSNVSPALDNIYFLGDETHRWANLWLGPGTIYITDSANTANVAELTVYDGVLEVNGATGLQANLINGNTTLTLDANANVTITVAGSDNSWTFDDTNKFTTPGNVLVQDSNQNDIIELRTDGNIAFNGSATLSVNGGFYVSSVGSTDGQGNIVTYDSGQFKYGPQLKDYAGNIGANNITITGLLKAPQTTKASNATGTPGQICWDANYIYVCTATNTWKRSPLTGGY